MRPSRVLIGALCLTLCGGCAAIPPAQVGQTAGTILGAAIVPGIGPPLGALAGLVAGMLVQGEVDKATEKHERKTLNEELAHGSSPAHREHAPLTGSPTRVWVDESVQGGRRIPGHFEARNLP